MFAPWQKSYDKLQQCIKKQRHHFAHKGLSSQSDGFSIVMYRAPNNWCFGIAVLEKTLESPLDWKEIKSMNPKENQPWTFIERTDAEAEAPILWPPDGKNQLTGKDPDAGKDQRQQEKDVAEDEMAR